MLLTAYVYFTWSCIPVVSKINLKKKCFSSLLKFLFGRYAVGKHKCANLTSNTSDAHSVACYHKQLALPLFFQPTWFWTIFLVSYRSNWHKMCQKIS